jgi:hypothetical protein
MDKMRKEESNEWIEGKRFKLRYVQGKVLLMENKAMIVKNEIEMFCNLLFYMRDILSRNKKGKVVM